MFGRSQTNNEHIFKRQQTKKPLQIFTTTNSLQFSCVRMWEKMLSVKFPLFFLLTASPLPKFISVPTNERWCVCLLNCWAMETRIFRPYSLHYTVSVQLACYLFEIEHIFFVRRYVQHSNFMRVCTKTSLGVSFLVLMEWLYYVNVIIFIIFVLFQHHEAHTHTHI